MNRCERRYVLPPLWHQSVIKEDCDNDAAVMVEHDAGAILFLCKTCRNDLTNDEAELQDSALEGT